ncbi:4Fe-4S binding protein [Micromonospora halophytica]|uniref:4Fe-4S dicluster domain-containing protein n=1 Tax=Micromonospora halophytica TaxID=47864 RepID=A0A1C5HHF1_9ACTN|nr:4Fe-4S binding protein [Micromonospora halophytica]SCG45448.1 4Fe-4S dicluster domain-containing protein [Micromonospora halophytica]
MTAPPTAVAAPDPPAPVSIGACQGCGACLLTCPTHAIRPVPLGLTVRADRCTGCLECVEICPVDAIRATAEPRGER